MIDTNELLMINNGYLSVFYWRSKCTLAAMLSSYRHTHAAVTNDIHRGGEG